MSTPEGKVKKFIDNKMREWYPNAFRHAPPGTGIFGRNGMPDRIWTIRGNEICSIVVAIEAKAERGELTKLQLKTLTDLAKQGAISAVVTGKDIAHMMRIRTEIDRRLALLNATTDSI
jgi:hypothetical protein